ncbi:hypothetical protein [Helicobacter sp. MIT 99-5507]|uniref:hypothetical protein n=1 Tax=Helicobacter sp. MIT 99-5507 TaxID=152489 RepID=UPI000E1F05CD|nr:hypothetical protein [Helicobacter sp. MIT 99-5507]RDU56642.1 hypothetical protein CQA42_07450 [Helicobacter sp. MIT 99-5507]
MNDLATRLVKAPLKIEFSKIDNNYDTFKMEFDLLSQNNDDPIGLWLKNIRARGKVVDENEPLLQLLVELHRKIDILNARLSNETKEYIKLDSSHNLDSVGHNILVFRDDCLDIGEHYYSRLDIAVFPIRKMPIFFESFTKNQAKIILMHSRDIIDFDGYIASKERANIREEKLKNKN